MKHMKKLVCLLLAMVMILAMGTTAFATMEGTLDGGSITINDAVVGQKYNVYQILYIESYNATTNSYSYKANAAWEGFVKSAAIKDVYLSTDAQDYVTWVSTLDCKNTEEHTTADKHTAACYKEADAAAFAKLAQAYAADKANKISADRTTTANGKTDVTTVTTVKFEGLKLGYYLVDTTLGTLCSLDTTNPNVTMEEKNAAPASKKEVQEDSKVNETNKGWGATNDADIGQTVNFRGTIIAQAGAENYVFHDEMSSGLTYQAVTGVTLNNVAVDAKCYTVKTTDLDDDCTFEVVFTQEFCDTLKADDKIVISYTAKLNADAVVGLPGNPNESHLSYGDKSYADSGEGSGKTPPSETITYTWDMDILKYGNGDVTNVLKDAQFVLLNNNKSMVAKVTNGKITDWEEVPADGKSWSADSILTTGEDGKIEIDGLDADTYYLREIKAPAGFNKLSGDEEVEITGATETTVEPEGSEQETTVKLTYTTVIKKINNQSGTELPSTGGMGTTIFYVLGSVLVLGAVVVMVSKKRMSAK